MGRGSKFRCKNCGYEYFVLVGLGGMFPQAYQDCITDIESGKYGEEWKTLLKSQKYVAVDAEVYLYVCRSCGNWKTDMSLSLYAPNDPDKIPDIQYGIKTVKEWGYVPYVTSVDLEENYSFMKSYVHKCDKCGKRMHKDFLDNSSHLPCPKCGTKNIKVPGILRWD